MRRSPRARRQELKKPEKTPTADDFKGGAVQKAVLAQTLQRPETMWAGGAAIAFLAVIFAIEPGSTLFGVLSFLSGLTSVCSWVVNFFIRGETFVKRHIQYLLELREQSTVHEVRSMQHECDDEGFEEGLNAARELDYEYQKLRGFLREKVSEDNLSAQRYIALAEDVYREGVVVLRKALAIYHALRKSNKPKLEGELVAWQQELDGLTKSEDKSPEVHDAMRGLQRRVEDHTQRVQMYVDREHDLRELLDKCEQLEAALEKAYLEVIDIIDDSARAATFFQGDAASRLQHAVSAARKVEDRLRGLGDTSAEDDMYLRAGREGPSDT